MCGILGFIGTRWREHAAPALAAMRLRGPDEQSVLNLGEAVLGHARLAVIDLAGGHQPMTSPDGRHTIVFNGEIYNFAELRRDLEAKGYGFATRSDTEVLLHGHAAWGEALLERLDGMFAFAVWDARERRLFAARDPLGIKPFMYAAIDGGLVFASTLAPFLALPGFPRRLDPEALRDYLAFQTPLAPHTFVRAVGQLPPGHLLRFDAATGKLETARHWSIPRSAPCNDDRETLVARMDAALKESVRRQLVADVPLGAFLSGGIDSSLMVRYMAEARVHPLKTFSLRFANEGFDESPHARIVARQFGCEHHELEAPTITGEAFAAAIGDLDQPLADPAYVMTHALSRLTRQHVTVAISGDGGDELFCGYPRFLDTEDRHARKFWQPLLRRLVTTDFLPASLLRRSLWGQELLHYRRVELGPWPGRKNLARYLAPEIAVAARPERTLGLWLDLLGELGGRMDTATLMRADLWTYLSENCLVKTDRASMAHSLEVRVPMLGRPVLDAVLHLPPEVHTAGGAKSLLLDIARRSLPETVWNRAKHGFSVPLREYFSRQWLEVCDNCVGRCEELAPFLDATAVRQLWSAAQAGRSSRRLAYTFVVLLVWLSRHDVRA
ncbi:MAG TPA: asparagine synthase (glutamine-hydrolyzing) [Rhodocyclaceae bacterium]|nr:asparagine synthase (glutamine-hydrolyzing) [Rhodocyclaceae bacterium]